MTADAWLTALVVVLILVALVLELASPSVLVFTGVVVLLLLDVLDAQGALSGFSNPAPFTVGALFVVARAVSKTGAIRPLTRSLLGETGSVRRPLLRMLVPTTFASGFMNNIPLVAMMIPEVSAWARKRGSDVSRFLLPLSYAAILGGLLTIIGTSTNLVVAGQMSGAGLESFGFFELGLVGLPIVIIGVPLVIAMAPKVLGKTRPKRPGIEDAKDFFIEMEVEPGGPLDGRTVDEAGLRHLQGVFLVSVDRQDAVIAPATPTTVLKGRDHLRFAGRVDQVLDLESIRGLRQAEHDEVSEVATVGASYFTVAIGGDSPLVGQTLKQAGFRSQYQAAVVAIHRAGERIDAKLGEVPLRIGDALVVVSDAAFKARWQNRSDFLLVAELDDETDPVAPGRGRTLAVLLTMILLAATGVVPVLHAALGAAIMMIVLRVLTPDEARRALDLEVLGVIAAAFGLAAAVERSGLADVMADGIISAFSAFGGVGVVLGVVLATVALTELVTNNAAALLMFPIAIAAAPAAGVDPRGMAVAVAISASAAFLTPIGYQTNTMVYGPGGYRISHYLKAGLPLTALVVVAIAAIVPAVYG